MFIQDKNNFKSICCSLIVLFVVSIFWSDVPRLKAADASVAGLPEPVRMVKAGEVHQSALLRGLKVDYNNPLDFQFIFDTADEKDVSRADAERLINYFFAALAVPNESIWVNLSPYEADRIVEDSLEQTDLGRDLLAQDYILKQLSSSLTHPDTELGKKYWKQLSTAESSAFRKIWITPDTDNLEVMEGDGFVWVARAGLTAQSERDYVAQKIENRKSQPAGRAGKIDGTPEAGLDILLPAVSREINNGKNFVKLRQMYNAMILAMWLKKRFAESFYAGYMDKENINGIETGDKQAKDRIFTLYKKSFEKGVYDVIKKVSSSMPDPGSPALKKRRQRFFSGGFDTSKALARDGKLNEDFITRAGRAVGKWLIAGLLVVFTAACGGQSEVESNSSENYLSSSRTLETLPADSAYDAASASSAISEVNLEIIESVFGSLRQNAAGVPDTEFDSVIRMNFWKEIFDYRHQGGSLKEINFNQARPYIRRIIQLCRDEIAVRSGNNPVTAKEIAETGLREVARIKSESRTLALQGTVRQMDQRRLSQFPFLIPQDSNLIYNLQRRYEMNGEKIADINLADPESFVKREQYGYTPRAGFYRALFNDIHEAYEAALYVLERRDVPEAQNIASKIREKNILTFDYDKFYQTAFSSDESFMDKNILKHEYDIFLERIRSRIIDLFSDLDERVPISKRKVEAVKILSDALRKDKEAAISFDADYWQRAVDEHRSEITPLAVMRMLNRELFADISHEPWVAFLKRKLESGDLNGIPKNIFSMIISEIEFSHKKFSVINDDVEDLFRSIGYSGFGYENKFASFVFEAVAEIPRQDYAGLIRSLPFIFEDQYELITDTESAVSGQDEHNGPRTAVMFDIIDAFADMESEKLGEILDVLEDFFGNYSNIKYERDPLSDIKYWHDIFLQKASAEMYNDAVPVIKGVIRLLASTLQEKSYLPAYDISVAIIAQLNEIRSICSLPLSNYKEPFAQPQPYADNYYERLGIINMNADTAEIAQAYRRAAFMFAPDRLKHNPVLMARSKISEDTEEPFKRINEAYAVLKAARQKSSSSLSAVDQYRQGGVDMKSLEDDLEGKLTLKNGKKNIFASSALSADMFANGLTYRVLSRAEITEQQLIAMANP